MQFISDKDVWDSCPRDFLWIYDKLILAQKLNYQAGPAGIPVPKANWYIVRPITNLRMMGRGAQKMWLEPNDVDSVPDGFFWCEIFTGRHLSIDYHYGIQDLTVEGFKDDPDCYNRFNRWTKVDDRVPFPKVLGDLCFKTPWVNVEMINGKIIEVHLRWNDDFANHGSDTIYPVWRDNPIAQPPGTCWYDSPCGDRLGFWIETRWR